jgi:glycosyltransferase involved in cell wall biosynthesis
MNILVVVHNYIGIGKVFGGVELTVKEILEAASSDSTNTNKYYVLSFDHRRKSQDDSGYVLMDMSQCNTDGTPGLEIDHFEAPYPVSLERYQDDEFTTKFRELIQRYGIDIVHFHHWLYYPLNAPLIAQQAGALTILSLHDYYALCPEWHLRRNRKTFCGFPHGVTLDTCNSCLKETFGYGYESQNLRRQLISEIFSMADAVQYQSEDERQRFCAAYPLLNDKETLVIGSPLVLNAPAEKSRDGVTPLPMVSSASTAQWQTSYPTSSVIPVICLGNVASEKGGDALSELFRRSAANSSKVKFQFHIYGDVRAPYDKKLEPLSKSGSVIVHGKYDSKLLLEELKGCHGIALFGSNWPETWVRTLSESTACGLVPIAPRIGAFIERISDGVNGILYEPASVDSLLAALDSFATNPAQLSSMQKELHRIPCPTIDDNIQAFHTLYAKVYETNTQPEYSRNRANKLARLFSTSRPIAWNMDLTMDAEPPMPVLASSGTVLKRKPLLQRTWGVLRSRGLVYTIWATFNYKKLRRTN